MNPPATITTGVVGGPQTTMYWGTGEYGTGYYSSEGRSAPVFVTTTDPFQDEIAYQDYLAELAAWESERDAFMAALDIPADVWGGGDSTEVAVAPNSTGNSTSPWQLGVQWLTGTGPRNQTFTDGDPMTMLLQQHSHIQDTRTIIANNIANGGDLKGSNNYGLGGIAGVPKYLKDYSTLATGGLTGNLAVTYLGSYKLDYNVTGINLENGTATVQFHVTNDSTINSATHPPVIGYTQTWNTYIGQPLNDFFSSGPMSKTSQDFQWTETIKWP